MYDCEVFTPLPVVRQDRFDVFEFRRLPSEGDTAGAREVSVTSVWKAEYAPCSPVGEEGVNTNNINSQHKKSAR